MPPPAPQEIAGEPPDFSGSLRGSWLLTLKEGQLFVGGLCWWAIRIGEVFIVLNFRWDIHLPIYGG